MKMTLEQYNQWRSTKGLSPYQAGSQSPQSQNQSQTNPNTQQSKPVQKPPDQNSWSIRSTPEQPESFMGKTLKGAADFAGGVARDIVKPVASLVPQMAGAFMGGIAGLTGDEKGEEKWKKPINLPGLGEVKMLSAVPGDVNKFDTKNAEETAGQAIDIAATTMGGGEAESLAKGVGKKSLGSLMKEGAVEGAKIGASGGMGSAMEQNQGAYDVAGSTVAGGVTGGILGGITAPALKGLSGLWDHVSGKAGAIEDVPGKLPPPELPPPDGGAPPGATDKYPGLKQAKITTPIPDVVKKQATKSGIQPRMIDLVENASSKDKTAMQKMVKSAEGYSSSYLAEHPTVTTGKTFLEHIKPIQAANDRAGKALGTVVKNMGDTNVSVVKPLLDFIGSLKDLRVNVNEDGVLDFADSALQGAQGGDSRAMLQKAYSKLEGNKDGMTAGSIQALKQSLGSDLGLGSGKQVIDSFAKTKLEGLRQALGDTLGELSPTYARANEKYASTQKALDSFEQLMGSKFSKVTPEVLTKRAGEVARRLQGNAPASAVEKTMEDIASAHKTIGFKPLSDLKRQAYFSGELDKLWDITKPKSFEGGIEKGTSDAIENAKIGLKATHDPLGAAAEAGMKILGKARSKEAQQAALKALLGM